MTEEIKYYKEKEYPLKWIPAEEMEETPQQTIDRLKQENEELKARIKHQCYKCRIGDTTEDKLRSALEEILESAKFAQCLPCGSGNLEDCLNCSDETTNNGQFCMEKRIHEIKTKCVEVLNN